MKVSEALARCPDFILSREKTCVHYRSDEARKGGFCTLPNVFTCKLNPPESSPSMGAISTRDRATSGSIITGSTESALVDTLGGANNPKTREDQALAGQSVRHDPWRISPSQISCCMGCPYSWGLRYLEGWELKEKPKYLVMGSYGHQLLRIVHNLQANLRDYELAIDCSELTFTESAGIHALVSLYQNELQPKLISGEVEPEAHREIHPPTSALPLQGYSDLWLPVPKRFCEFKFVSSLDRPMLQDIIQLTAYMLLFPSAEEVQRILLRKPQLRQKKDETEEQLAERICEDVKGNPTKYLRVESYRRGEIMRYKALGEIEFYSRLIKAAVDDYREGKTVDLPRNWRNCVTRGECEFLCYCSTGVWDQSVYQKSQRRTSNLGG